jgi:hypothetical protein
MALTPSTGFSGVTRAAGTPPTALEITVVDARRP